MSNVKCGPAQHLDTKQPVISITRTFWGGGALLEFNTLILVSSKGVAAWRPCSRRGREGLGVEWTDLGQGSRRSGWESGEDSHPHALSKHFTRPRPRCRAGKTGSGLQGARAEPGSCSGHQKAPGGERWSRSFQGPFRHGCPLQDRAQPGPVQVP